MNANVKRLRISKPDENNVIKTLPLPKGKIYPYSSKRQNGRRRMAALSFDDRPEH